jgi:hypothetical protein
LGAVAVGLLVEEQRAEIGESWRRAATEQLGGENAIEFAVGPLLRELSLALRGDAPALRPRGTDGLARCTVLVRSGAQPARVAREFKLLHRAVWDALRRAGRIVAADERRSADEWLDEALAATLDRIERVRMRIDLLERGPAVVPARETRAPGGARPPPLPAARPGGAARPPPLPSPARPGVVARPAPLPAWAPGSLD